LDWYHQGTRKRGSSKTTWKRAIERELRKVGISRKVVRRLALPPYYTIKNL
jgi:hypothetical protein